MESENECLLLLCELAVYRALEVAGKRMRGMQSRAVRADLVACEAHEVHTRISYASLNRRCDDLVKGAWVTLEEVLPGRPALYADLDAYVRELIEGKQPHSRESLRFVLAVHA